MNSLYLILIGITFTAGVLVTSFSNERNGNMKPVCEEKKTKVADDLKAVNKNDNNLGSWFSFEKK